MRNQLVLAADTPSPPPTMELRCASLLLAAATAVGAAPYEYTDAGLRGVESFLSETEYPQVQYPIRSMSDPVCVCEKKRTMLTCHAHVRPCACRWAR